MIIWSLLTFVVLISITSNFSLWLILLSFFLIVMYYYLFLINCSSGLQGLLLKSVYFDDVSYWLMMITIFVIFTSMVVHFTSTSTKTIISSPLFLLLFCMLVFSSSNFFFMYMYYEASLLPIAYIIVKWGHYSDRSSSMMYMMLYTAFFSFPLLALLLYWSIYGNIYSYSMFSYTSYSFNSLLLFMLFFAFLVKFPVYGLHYWLPMAHVEAPTFGSMILAGILLKLGGYGIYRFVSIFISWEEYFSYIFMVYFLFSLVISTFVTSVQFDFKRLVAYSSVVHMTGLCVILMTPKLFFTSLYLMVMVLHGLLSPLMFLMVGYIYNQGKTRNLLLMRMSWLEGYILLWVCSLIFLMNIPTPPFPQFFMEVMLFVNILSYSVFFVSLIMILYTFLSLIYNLVWFLPSLSYPLSSGLKTSSPNIMMLIVSLSYLGYIFLFFLLSI